MACKNGVQGFVVALHSALLGSWNLNALDLIDREGST